MVACHAVFYFIVHCTALTLKINKRFLKIPGLLCFSSWTNRKLLQEVLAHHDNHELLMINEMLVLVNHNSDEKLQFQPPLTVWWKGRLLKTRLLSLTFDCRISAFVCSDSVLVPSQPLLGVNLHECTKLPCGVVDVLTSQLSGDQAQAWQETLQLLHTAYNLGQNC